MRSMLYHLLSVFMRVIFLTSVCMISPAWSAISMDPPAPLTSDSGSENLNDQSPPLTTLSTFETVAQSAVETTTHGPSNFSFPMPADFNKNGCVDFADFLILESNFGLSPGAEFANGDANDDGTDNFSDFMILLDLFGECAVPEPSSLLIWIVLIVMAIEFRSRQHSHTTS